MIKKDELMLIKFVALQLIEWCQDYFSSIGRYFSDANFLKYV
jgi:hypothetical protein